MRKPGKTPPFRGADGNVVAGSIAEIGYRRLGGLDQWVMIRGESVANPPLMMLHGGRGFSETGLFRHFNAPLEKSFTVIYWDQRGAGKSADAVIPRSSMTVEQLMWISTSSWTLCASASARTGSSYLGTPGARCWECSTPRGSPRRWPHMSVAGRLATGPRPSQAHTRSPSPRRSAVAGAERSASCRRSGRRRTPPRLCSRSARKSWAWKAACAPGRCGRWASRAHQPRIVDLRAALSHPRLPVHHGRDVAGSLAAEPHRPRAHAAGAGVLLPRPQRSLRAHGHQPGLLRDAHSTVEAAHLV